MKRVLKSLSIIGLTTILSGCLYGQCFDGPCAFERAKMIEGIKPYGAHWIKDGMTRESRRFDLVACSSPNGEIVEFAQDQISREKKPSEPNGVAAYLRLRDKVGVCMQSKGYTPVGDLQFLGGCDARCLYP
jgi:hypothetical protein